MKQVTVGTNESSEDWNPEYVFTNISKFIQVSSSSRLSETNL